MCTSWLCNVMATSSFFVKQQKLFIPVQKLIMHVKITKTFIFLHKIEIKFENHIDMNSLFYTNLLFKKKNHQNMNEEIQ